MKPLVLNKHLISDRACSVSNIIVHTDAWKPLKSLEIIFKVIKKNTLIIPCFQIKPLKVTLEMAYLWTQKTLEFIYLCETCMQKMV